MSKVQVGDRVGAIISMDENEVHLLGYGVYDGKYEPPFGPFGMSLEAFAEAKAAGEVPKDFVWTNPRITLDDGRVVWGAECWWGKEDAVKAQIGTRTIVPV